MSQSNIDQASSPEISVVIPLFNKADYIKRAVDSVLFQTFTNFELVVVDDGSTDSSLETVKKFTDQRIRIIVQPNQGESEARNRGIHESKADLIAFLDADDEWKNEFLRTIILLTKKYPQAGAFATSYEIVTVENKIRLPNISNFPKIKWEGIINNFPSSALDEHPFNSSSIVVCKNVFKEVGGFPKGVKIGGDLDMWLRIALAYSIAFSSIPLAVYHQEAENRACEVNLYQGDVPFVKSARNAIEKGTVPPEIKNDLLEMVVKHQFLAVYSRLIEKDRIGALKILNSIRYTKRYRMQWIWWRYWSSMPVFLFHAARSINQLKKQIIKSGNKTSL